MRFRAFAVAACFTCVLHAAFAAELAGVEFPARIEWATDVALVLNGAGIRTRFLVDIYAVALYLPSATPSAAEAIGAAGPRRVAIAMLRDVDAQRFSDAVEKGLRANHDEARMQLLAPSLRQLRTIMTELGVAKTGMRINLDLVPGVGTVVAIDGRPRGSPIPGEDFYRALLKNWLGEHPISEMLKRALLGGADSAAVRDSRRSLNRPRPTAFMADRRGP